MCEARDAYVTLDLLDSLVRKSLLTVTRSDGHARFGMLETVRQFAEDELTAAGGVDDVRDRHAAHYAEQSLAHWNLFDTPGCRVAIDWVERELANLRAAFRWAAGRDDTETAATIASHTALLAQALLRYEPVSWAEEMLEAASTARVRHLPRLFTAAAYCSFVGRAERAVDHAREAVELEADPRFDHFELGMSGLLEGNAHVFAGRMDEFIEVSMKLTARPKLCRVAGLCGLTWGLATIGEVDEAAALADETLEAAHEYGSPYWIAFALYGRGLAFADSDPDTALHTLARALQYARDHRVRNWEALIARDAARMEAIHGQVADGLTLFDTTIAAFHRAGDHGNVSATLASLAVFFNRTGRSQAAATIYGACTRHNIIESVPGLTAAIGELRETLGETTFTARLNSGRAMESAEAVHHARQQIELFRAELAGSS
jgi:tetratricopeptide (TPR) repeat protein